MNMNVDLDMFCVNDDVNCKCQSCKKIRLIVGHAVIAFAV